MLKLDFFQLYMSLSFISTLQGVKKPCNTFVINYLRHMLFDLGLPLTGCIRYSSSISVTKKFQKKVNMFPATLLLSLSAKKTQPIIFNSTQQAAVLPNPLFLLACLFKTGNV